MGLIHFQKIQSLDFFHHLSLENAEKYWPFDTDLVKFWQLFCVLHFNVFWKCPLSDFNFVCRQVTRVLNYFSTKFHEFLTSDSVEISSFSLNHAVTIFWSTAHALHLTGFSVFLNSFKQCQKGRKELFSIVTFNTLKNKRFSPVTNCLIVETEKKTLAQSSLDKIK